MPRIPSRSSAPTIGPNPELLASSETTQPSIPVRKPEKSEDTISKRKIRAAKISVREWQGPAPEDIYRALTGKEPQLDPHTGQLVHKPTDD